MDYLKIREGFNEGSAVSVNHKALITRALTKYPVDYALFRELLQNSADAQAKTATIQFESASTNTSIAHIHQLSINRLRFSNDGLDFAADDWKRLREIASGNPNETKIGAFGVGFYSVFELTDEPLVHSGDKIMNFRYKGVQLQYNYVEKAPCYQKGTLIDIPYKSEGQLPDLVKFIGFLVQSFLLVNLEQINLEVKYGNGKVVKLLTLSKEIQSPTVLKPPTGYNSKSPRKMLNMALIQSSACRISISYLNITQMPPLSMSKGLFSFGKQLVSSLVTTTGNPEDYTDITFDLTKVDATVDVSVSSSFRKQMIETLLKPPPKQAVMSLLSFNGTLPSKDLSQQLRAYVFPEENNDAKIFIGFPTKQSTGLKSHLALNQVIPTMERTAIDMSNQFVKDWNCEMLYMAGVMARCAYENELNNCRTKTAGGGSLEEADFIISRFRFSRSAPDAVIGLYIKEGFWKCSKSTLVPTTQGIVPNSEARFAGDASELLRKVPVVSNEGLAEDLKALQLVREVSHAEIAADIGNSPISVDLAKKYLAWLAPKWQSLNQSTQITLLSAARIKVDSGHVIDLGSCQWFHDRSKLPDDDVASNLPPNCLPHELASKLGHTELVTVGLKRLDIMQWAQFRFMTLSKHSGIAYSVLRVASNSWPRLPQSTRRELRTLFESVPCIPTKSSGMKLPSHTYVETVKLFPHLPVIDPSLELPKSWLREIGLRESVDMSFVLEALNGNDLKWTNEDLVAYLVENAKTLKQSDWAILKEGQFFAKHGGEKTQQHQLFRAKDLYAPSPELRSLGLPTIAFKNWEAGSQQASLLAKIGLHEYPPAELLFANVNNLSVAQIALRYFVRHYEEAGYSYRQIANLAVIPTLASSTSTTSSTSSEKSSAAATELARPSECFRDPELAAFGEKVVSPAWEPASARLGIRKRPKIGALLERVLANPPRYLSDPSRADRIFSYLALNVGDIGDKELRLCQNTAFIPVHKKSGVVFERPTSVFLPYDHTQSNGDGDLLRPLLQTVHASRRALPFFYTIGISDRPSLTQLVEIMLDKPHEVFDILKSDDSYEEILVRIESKWSTISHRPDLVKRMKQEPWLLGIKFPVYDSEKPTSSSSGGGGQISLYRASEIVIVDDVSIFSQFKHKIITAPQVDALERLYSLLGIPKLSQILKESIHIGGPLGDETQRSALQRRIDERLKLFRANTSKQLNPKFGGVEVSLVKSLEIYRQLPPHSSIVTRTSACIHPSSKNKLLIVPGSSFDWIDVASAIAKLVLLRPDQDSIVVLEIQLSLDLDTLEKKGYNVEKLRQQNAQSKPVKKVSIRDDTKTSFQPPTPPPTNTSAKQPPSLPPKESKEPPPQSLAPQPLSPQPLPPQPIAPQSLTPQHPPPSRPPPYTDNPARTPTPAAGGITQGAGGGFFNKFKDAFSGISGNASRGGGSILTGGSGQGADTVGQLNQGLQRAQRFSSSSLSAPNYVDTPAPMGQDYCAPQKVQNIQLIGAIRNQIQVFATPQRPQPAQDETALADALIILCKVFNYPITAVNIHRDEDTKSIAFNYNGSLFFNSCVRPSPGTILEYYYPVMAHELAHNLVSAHNASHSFFTEAYIQATLSKFPNKGAITN